jgi:hypothetical protein
MANIVYKRRKSRLVFNSCRKPIVLAIKRNISTASKCRAHPASLMHNTKDVFESGMSSRGICQVYSSGLVDEPQPLNQTRIKQGNLMWGQLERSPKGIVNDFRRRVVIAPLYRIIWKERLYVSLDVLLNGHW